jgi:hypothetical protein
MRKLTTIAFILMLTGAALAQQTKPDSQVILKYDKQNRTLQVGKTYRGRVNYGSAYGMTLTPYLRLPRYHLVMYYWPNVKDFPALDPDKSFGVKTIVFRVMRKEVELLGKNAWTITFTIDIIKVE